MNQCPHYAIRELMSESSPIGEKIKAAGWVKTRRDSKAGFSFINLHDGSAFQGLQIVAPNTLPNYAEEILHLTAGCSIEVQGTLVESPAKGQKAELQAESLKVLGWVEDRKSVV